MCLLDLSLVSKIPASHFYGVVLTGTILSVFPTSSTLGWAWLEYNTLVAMSLVCCACCLLVTGCLRVAFFLWQRFH